jgi:hypothetical protein
MFTELKRGNGCGALKAFYKVHYSGKKAIPQLIEFIAVDFKADLHMLIDPWSSHMGPGASNNYAGEWAVYGINMILFRQGEPPKDACPWPPYGSDRAKYLRVNGSIVKGKENSPVTHKDMFEIQRVYRDWWEQNKDKSIEQLRLDWKNGNRPLAGSIYHW